MKIKFENGAVELDMYEVSSPLGSRFIIGKDVVREHVSMLLFDLLYDADLIQVFEVESYEGNLIANKDVTDKFVIGQEEDEEREPTDEELYRLLHDIFKNSFVEAEKECEDKREVNLWRLIHIKTNAPTKGELIKQSYKTPFVIFHSAKTGKCRFVAVTGDSCEPNVVTDWQWNTSSGKVNKSEDGEICTVTTKNSEYTFALIDTVKMTNKELAGVRG